ncbi:carbohydrate ABC transporter permease [Deinococcus roseus]|uniref:Sugar ABC transporter permease n=1 Tax=Deinococcus roseus TaxID=392414 RepID=A0ABQ2D631_9DEIO|nr:sugar ABC transporter permease [Deinococcus roseus]GGJ47251.1 sugar ABC transporter permease [Deinococcus roseus]
MNLQSTSSTPTRTPRKTNRSSWWTAYLLVLPFAAVYLLFLIYPTLSAIQLSFTSADLTGVGPYVGLKNYITLLSDPRFWDSVKHTLYFMLLTVIPNTLVGFMFALMVARLRHLKSWVLSIFFLPNVLPVSVVTAVWVWILDPSFGVFNYLFKTNTSWFEDPTWAMPFVALVTIWWSAGFNMLLILAAIQNVPKELYEAASLDGANTWQAFWAVTWPTVWPVTSLALLLQLIAQFKIFDQVYLLTGGGPFESTTVVLMQLYKEGFQQTHGGYASTIAVVFMVIILLASWVQNKLLGGKK